jgi:hypothetical protein
MDGVMIVLLIVAAVCFLIAAACSSFSVKYQNENGYYYLGGFAGLAAWRYFAKHKQSKAIFDKLEEHGTNWTEQSFLDNLFAAGVKGLITAKYCSDVIVITDEMILVYGTPNRSAYGTKGQLFTRDGWSTFKACLHRNEVKEALYQNKTVTPARKKSVVGSAVAGAVVAGGAGAVVGAVAAASHNNTAKGKVKTENVYGRTVSYYYTFSYYFDHRTFELDTLYEADGRTDPHPSMVNFNILFHPAG